MTAIAGLFATSGQTVPLPVLERMSALLAVYGKDAQHLEKQMHVGMARALLRITPEDAFDRQPILDHGAGLMLVFDGRLDNREELRRELGLAPEAIDTVSDSFLVLQAWKKWGRRAPRHLLGDFAIACWSRSKNDLTLVRDPMGIRPLFWTRQDDLIGFATMPKALFAIPGVSQELSEERLHDMMCLLPMQGQATLFRDVNRVEPGELVTIETGRVCKEKYHSFSARKRMHFASDEDYLEAFRSEVERAVSCRLRSISGVASELSSGFDSSTVTSIAAEQLQIRGKRLSSYTSVPREDFDEKVLKGWYANEGPGASAVAERHENIDHVLVRANDESPIDRLEQNIELRDAAPANLCNLVWINEILRQAASDGSKVLLGGLFGNMNISYDGAPYLPWLLKRGRLLELRRELRAFKARKPNASNRRLLEHCLGPFLPRWVWHKLMERRGRTNHLFDYSPIHPEFARRIGTHQRSKRLGWDLSYRPWADGRKMRIAVLERIDIGEFYAACNAYGIERRDVTADVRLIEFCLAIPESQYFRDGQTGWLLRRLMKDSLPRKIFETRGRGLQGADWHVGAENSLPKLRATLAELKAHPKVGTYVDLESLEKALENWPDDGWESYEAMQRYRSKLLKGLSFGAFIRYTDPEN